MKTKSFRKHSHILFAGIDENVRVLCLQFFQIRAAQLLL